MPDTKRQVKWEDSDSNGMCVSWIARMNSYSAILYCWSDGFCKLEFLGVHYTFTAPTEAKAKAHAVRWARKQIRALAREWGVR